MKTEFKLFDNVSEENNRRENLKKCSKCILPLLTLLLSLIMKVYPTILRIIKKQDFLGDEKLFEILDKYRSKNGEPDCVVGLSGGRDSSYGLHLLKTKFKNESNCVYL